MASIVYTGQGRPVSRTATALVNSRLTPLMRKPVYQNSYGPITRKLPCRRFLVPLPSHLFPNLIHRLGRVILVGIFARSFPHLITLSPPIVGNRHYPTCRDVIVLHLRLYPYPSIHCRLTDINMFLESLKVIALRGGNQF